MIGYGIQRVSLLLLFWISSMYKKMFMGKTSNIKVISWHQAMEMWAPKPNCPYPSIIRASSRSPYSCNSHLPLPILLFKHLCFNISIWVFSGFGISPELGYFNLLHLKSFLDRLWKNFIMIIIINDDNDKMAYSLSGGFVCIYLSHLVQFYLN